MSGEAVPRRTCNLFKSILRIISILDSGLQFINFLDIKLCANLMSFYPEDLSCITRIVLGIDFVKYSLKLCF